MVGFRDWLRTHDDDRELYETTKRELLKREWKFVQNYADAKGDVVEEIVGPGRAAGPARGRAESARTRRVVDTAPGAAVPSATRT